MTEYKNKRQKSLQPENFKLETTTVWSFPDRGEWATHNGKYRGNWSPYIPRNIIMRYSSPGETVLDQFVGGGTTLIEAKLLGRHAIGIDINPAAVELTKNNLNFECESLSKITVQIGDARNLSFISSEKIDLICTHPPYANIIKYSDNIDGDLSRLNINEFLKEMNSVANEAFRVLKKDRYCAILIGDTRKKKHVVPIGFQVMQVFLKAGFVLKEIIIKQQHNCQSTPYWAQKSIESNFLLIMHEYLFVFRKP
jgi:DNA modification methylase